MKPMHGIAMASLLLAGTVAGLAFAWSSMAGATVEQQGVDRPAPDASGFDAARAGVVRIIARQETESPDAECRLLAEVQHAGPLLPGERDQLLQTLDGVKRRREEKLAGFHASAADSAALLAEAMLLLEVSRDGAAIEAIAMGSYVVTLTGQEAPPLVMPGCEVMCMGIMTRGQSAAITVMMPFVDHSDLARAREYYDAVRVFDDSERARRFNALPDVERFHLAREISRIRKSVDSTDEERRFVRETIGFGTELLEQSAIVIVRNN